MASKEQREKFKDQLRKTISSFDDSNRNTSYLLTKKLNQNNSDLSDLIWQLFNYVDVLDNQVTRLENTLNTLVKSIPELKPVYAPIKIHELGEEELSDENTAFAITTFDLYTFNTNKLPGHIHFLTEASNKDKTSIEIVITTEDDKEKSYYTAMPFGYHAELYEAFKRTFKDIETYSTLTRIANYTFNYPVFKFTETKLEDIVKVINEIKQDCFNKEEILDL